ncbi:MAG: hypothetical protein O7I93_01615 [Gemmatimonadetes bacterium]|nr:hypothetical protein [Gemmatimonadota bacterium]
MTDRESDRRYTDQEVALVLKRAAELEERGRDGPAAGRGEQDAMRYIMKQEDARLDAHDLP